MPGDVLEVWLSCFPIMFLFLSYHYPPTTSTSLLGVSKQANLEFTGVYGWNERQNKHKTCDLFLDLKLHSSLLWVVGGDYNEIFFNSEKRGGPLKAQPILDKFHNTLEECDLFDLGFIGREYTWWNGQSGRDSVEEHLDRVCTSD